MEIKDVTDVVGIAALFYALFVAGMSIVVFFYYANKKSKLTTHVALMALSYTILTFLVAAALNFRIFYNGGSRLVGSIIAVIAFVLGTIGLLLIFRYRRERASEGHKTL